MTLSSGLSVQDKIATVNNTGYTNTVRYHVLSIADHLALEPRDGWVADINAEPLASLDADVKAQISAVNSVLNVALRERVGMARKVVKGEINLNTVAEALVSGLTLTRQALSEYSVTLDSTELELYQAMVANLDLIISVNTDNYTPIFRILYPRGFTTYYNQFWSRNGEADFSASDPDTWGDFTGGTAHAAHWAQAGWIDKINPAQVVSNNV